MTINATFDLSVNFLCICFKASSHLNNYMGHLHFKHHGVFCIQGAPCGLKW